jgi:FAD/FMN-containing dehydrogenase
LILVQTLRDPSGTAIPDDAVQQFRDNLNGKLIEPGSAAYDEARKVFNGMIDRKPGLIVQPTDTSDVQKAVNFARENNLLVSIHGGGHSVQGYGVCDDGLMIDLRSMRRIDVDPEKQIAVAEGGANWGEFDAVTQVHGLAVTGGRMPTTGIAGLTLGSGSGWLERKLGFTVDNLLGAEVVLASGEVVHASDDENADLFWGLRGGGGNYGIVTKFEYKLHKVGPKVFAGQLAFPRNPLVLKKYRDFMETADENICGAAVLISAPEMDPIPEPVRGMPVMGLAVLYLGDPKDGPEAIKPLLELGPVMNMTQEMTYCEFQDIITEGNPPGVHNYWKADFYPELPDEAIDKFVEVAAEPPSKLSTLIMMPNTGAMQRVPEEATALGWRKAKWSLHLLGLWEDPEADDENIAWIRQIADAMKPWAQEAAYLNYLMDEGEQRVKDSFGEKYQRMVELKNKYDPTNFFRLNQNIKPVQS